MSYSHPTTELQQCTTVTIRAPLHLKQRWQEAATLRGLTLTDFFIAALNEATGSVFEEESRIRIAEKDSLLLAEMLARPLRPNERLGKAVRDELEQMKDY